MSTRNSVLIGVACVAISQAVLADPPDTIQATGVVRDFRERTVEGGHPDFENPPNPGLGRYAGNVAAALDPFNNPAFTGAGFKIASQWRDSENRVICPSLYNEALGDTAGSAAQPSTAGITSAESFSQWFREQLGVNTSAPLTITLNRNPATGMYVFDDTEDPLYAYLGGFFPIDNQLFGNSGGSPDHNYHFTFELQGDFVHDASQGYNFKFDGEGDIWVFINGQLVIDLVGVHAALDQYVDLARLNLTDGETYPLHFFFAQRLRPQSHFRIETNIPINWIPYPLATGRYD